MKDKDLADLKRRANVPGLIGGRWPLKQEGSGFMARCPFHDDKTPSFHLDTKQGTWLWKCFGCGKGGDIITFIELYDHCDTAVAIQKLKQAVDGGDDFSENTKWVEGAAQVQENFSAIESKQPKRVFTVAQWETFAVEPLWQNQEALNWLRNVRGIQDDEIRNRKLGYKQTHVYRIKDGFDHVRHRGWIAIPRLDGDRVVAIKFRSVVEKVFSQVNGMDSRALFNVDTINPLEPVYVTEGEFDACILEQAGFRAVSCPSAGVDITTQSRIKIKLAERIFLAGDNDGGVGNEYMRKLLKELDGNTHWLVWPDGTKDANDFFINACGRDLTKFHDDVAALSKKAKDAPPEGFVPLSERLRSIEGTDMGADPARLHFPPNLGNVDRMTYTPRGGVMVMYSTYSGTGKSMLKTQILTYEACRGEVVVDLSPEIRDDEYLALVTSQIVGPEVGGLRRTGAMDRKYFVQAADMLEKQAKANGVDFRYYVGHNVLGQTEEEVLQFLENTIRTLGATRFAIDTFHRLIFAEKQGQVQAEGSMIKKIEALGNKYGTIFIVICQSNAEAEGIDNLKKNEHGVLRGSREIRDIPASIYLLHRNRRPQRDGQDPDDVLEPEAGLFAKKTRFKGPGKPQVRLLLQEENSLFVQQTGRPEPADGGGDQRSTPDIGEQDFG